MIKSRYYLLVFFIINSCIVVNQDTYKKKFLKASHLTNIPKQDTTYFIKDTRIDLFFNKNKSDRDIHIYKRKDGYTFWQIYSKRNYRYLGGGNKFYEVFYGKWSYYDDNGKLREEKDYDEPYKFSVNQLIKKMKKEYQMNLAVNDKDKRIDVRRYVDKDYSFYNVYYIDSLFNYRDILIDGTTGKTLVFQKKSIDSVKIKKTPLVYDIYFDSINKVRQNYDKK